MQDTLNPGVDRDGEDGIDLHGLLGMVLDRLWMVAGIALTCLLAAGLYVFSATRIYQSDALIQVETKNTGASAALGDLAETLGTESPVAGELEIIRSRMVIGQVVDKLGLTIRAEPKYFPIIGRSLARRFTAEPTRLLADPHFGASRFAWGGESIALTRLDVPDDLLGETLTLSVGVGGAYKLYDDGRLLIEGRVGELAEKITPTGNLAVFLQSIQARPETFFLISRSAREAAISRIAENLTVSEKGRQSGIIQVTYKGDSPSHVADVLNAIASTYQRQNVERKSAEAQSTLDFLQQQLPELKKKVEASESELNAYKLRAGTVDLTQETQIVLQESVQLQQLRLELEQKRREALQRFTANHPVVQTIDAQIGRINASIGSTSSRTKALPETQQELLTLMQNLKVNTDLYTNLLNNAQELQVVKAGTVGNVRIVDFAFPARLPMLPKSVLIMALALALGLFAGVIVAIAAHALNPGVQDPAEVERILGLPTYANVPYADEQKSLLKVASRKTAEHALLAVSKPNDLAVESLRSLRSTLHFAMLDASNNVVMITGPSPNLGKSFISTNLGATLASTGKRVVVVDADMRRGHIHTLIGKARMPGLSDVISGTATLQQALVAAPADNLAILPTGTIPPNPSELLLSAQFSELLRVLSAQFDIVLVDTPPVLAVADAAVVGAQAGTTLLVLKTGEHPLRMIEDTVRRLRGSGVVVRGTIFNQTRRGAGYGSKRYGYRYGYYNYQYSR